MLGVPFGVLLLFWVALTRIENAIKSRDSKGSDSEYSEAENKRPFIATLAIWAVILTVTGLTTLKIISFFGDDSENVPSPTQEETIQSNIVAVDKPSVQLAPTPTISQSVSEPTTTPEPQYATYDRYHINTTTDESAPQIHFDDPPNYFTVGSSRQHVVDLQGKPDTDSDVILSYGLSTVYFDDDGKVKFWTDASKNLKAKFPKDN